MATQSQSVDFLGDQPSSETLNHPPRPLLSSDGSGGEPRLEPETSFHRKAEQVTRSPFATPSEQFSSRSPISESSQNDYSMYEGCTTQVGLASESNSIYKTLVTVESKCIEVYQARVAAPDGSTQKPTPDDWQALLALHRTLLEEHVHFLWTSQHPLASPAAKNAAVTLGIPARMWTYGICTFAELLRQQLPESLEHLLSFLHWAYDLIVVLYETVTAFKDTWTKYLGFLSRCRMGLEDAGTPDRITWTAISRNWYIEAADRNPECGRMYHDIGTLKQKDILCQLYYYGRSSSSVELFSSTRGSMKELFKSFLHPEMKYPRPRLSPHDFGFIETHAFAFVQKSELDYNASSQSYLKQLDRYMGQKKAKWAGKGVYIAIVNISGWFDYGIDKNYLRQRFCDRNKRGEESTVDAALNLIELQAYNEDPNFCRIRTFTNDTLALVLGRLGHRSVLQHVHIMLAFFATLAASDLTCHLIDQCPWAQVAEFLNDLIRRKCSRRTGRLIVESLRNHPFDHSSADAKPLPEDYSMQGQLWAGDYFPSKWFQGNVDVEERYLKLPSTTRNRAERVLRLGYQLSTVCLDNPPFCTSLTSTKFGHWISFQMVDPYFSVL